MGFRFTQKRRGGAFVAKGSYGCVFKKPPLKCLRNSTRKDNSYISKLSSKNTADEEYAQSLIIRHYDPEERYFVTAESACEFNSANVTPENKLNKCDLNTIKKAVRNKNFNNTGLVLYKNAGIDLHRLPLAVEDYIPFYESVVNLFNALKFIHSKGILHRDLKSDNVISLKNADGSFTTRLIDVGFMCPLKPLQGDVSEMLSEQQKYFARACTFWYGNKKARSYGPFYEYMFGEPKKGKMSRIQEYQEGEDFSPVYVEWVNKVSEHLGTDDPFKKEDGTPTHRYQDVMDALVEVWRGNEMKQFSTSTGVQSTGPEFVLELASKADVFCLGFIVSKLQHRYVKHTVERKEGVLKTFIPRSTKLKNAGAPEIWIEVNDLSRYGVPTEEAEWHIAVANRISIPLHTLMVRMSDLDPRRAIDLTQAVSEYSDILTAVRDLYTPSKVYKGLKAIDEFAELEAPKMGVSKRSSPSKPAAAAAAAVSASTPSAKHSKRTSTRKLKLGEAEKKALEKKKKAFEKAKKEAAQEIQDAEEEVSDARKKQRELEAKLDAAKRDKVAAKVIADFEKALAKFTKVIEKALANLEEVREEAKEAVSEKRRAYNEYRAGLPRAST